LLLILFTFYYFVATEVIPRIANNIKARNINEETKSEQEQEIKTEGTTLLYSQIKQDLTINQEINT